LLFLEGAFADVATARFLRAIARSTEPRRDRTPEKPLPSFSVSRGERKRLRLRFVFKTHGLQDSRQRPDEEMCPALGHPTAFSRW
jgi:hypothetical protein